MADEPSDDLVELQTKVQFQEDALQQMEVTVMEQNQLIEHLNRRLKLLEDRVQELERAPAGGESEPPPPHY